MRLCVGDDWAQDHHDIEVMDEAGTVLATGRLPEGVAGIGRLHEMIGRFLPAGGDAEVQVGIETDRGPWVAALIAAGYVVFAVNPLQASRYRAGAACPGPRATAATRTCWPMRCAPMRISCARRPAAARQRRQLRCWPARTRR